jgi:hypothetical protein
MVTDSDLLPWSLFELSSSDETALDTLTKASILLPLGPRGLEDLNRGLQEGRRVALSLKTAIANSYRGLCVFGLERPSPAIDKSLSLMVFSLEVFPRLGETRDLQDRDSLARSLLGEVLRFCKTHGFTRIQCDAPDDADALALLIRCGFRVESSLHTGAGRAFGMSLDIAPSYTGDPYDGKHVIHWLAEQFRITRRSSTDTALDGYLPLGALNPNLGRTRPGEYALPIRLELTSSTRSPQRQLALRAMLGAESPTEPLINFGIDDLKELTQTPRLDLTLWPPPPDGASIVVEIREDLFGRFSSEHENAYFDSGAYGTLLERAIDNGSSPYIFFVDFETAHSNPRLIGFARVTQVSRADPQRIWSEWGHLSSWPDEVAFARYRAIKRKMTVLIFTDLRQVDVVGVGLPFISHSWTYVPTGQAYQVARNL